MKNITTDMVRELLVDKGLTDAQAAEELSVSRMTVSRYRKRIGIAAKPKRPKGYYDLTEDQERTLKELYQAGLNDYEVAKRMHLGRTRLRLWRKKHGILSQTNKKGLDLAFCLDVAKCLEEGKTLEEVAKSSGVVRSSISRVFKRYGLNTGRENRSRPPWVDQYCLTDYQKSVIIGDLFGDGHVGQTSDNTCYYSCSHSAKQDFFAIWKYQSFFPMSSRIHYGEQKNYYNSSFGLLPYVSVSTWSAPCFNELRSMFYKNGEKELTPKLVEYMDALSMAVWYMGDGSKNGKTAVFHVGLGVALEPLADALSDRFKIEFSAKKYEKEWHLRVMSPEAFFELIAPYMLSSFSYKLPEEYRGDVGKGLPVCSVSPDIEVSTEVYSRLPLEQQRQIREGMYLHYRKRGFPYPKMSLPEIKKEIHRMFNKKLSIDKYGIEGQAICNAFMPHRYDGKRYDSDPMSHWNDDVKFRRLIENRLKYAGGKITEASMRRGIALKGIPANFSPMLAAAIYRRYAKPSLPVLDFSAGYGGRLLGYLRSQLNCGYHGVEPYSKSFDGLQKIKEVCCPLFGENQDNVRLINEPFEDVFFSSETYGLIFSSPPYYKLEEYGCEDTQSIERYPEYSGWLECFWYKVFQRAKRLLVPGGIMAFSIGNYKGYDLVEDSFRLAQKVGLKEVAQHQLSYHNVFQNSTKTEGLFVFQK